ncbi:MAG: hypothetical protein AAB389_00565 [Patescibacteria group bacterium]
MEKTSEGKLLELATRICTEENLSLDALRKGRSYDAIYLVGQTEANEESVLRRCYQIIRDTCTEVRKICLVRSQFPPEKRKYPNFAVDWKRWLSSRSSSALAVGFSIFDFPEGPVEHTGTEMMGLVSHSKKQDWKDVLLIAAPFHQLRSFLSAVAATRKLDYPVRLWNLLGVSLPWGEQSVHSQGVQTGTRSDFIHAELEKVKVYSARGDIATVEEGIEYLNWRDAQK